MAILQPMVPRLRRHYAAHQVESSECAARRSRAGKGLLRLPNCSTEFRGNSITAREKRLQIAASRQKRLPPRANHDEASEDEHCGDADGQAHGQTARPLFTL